MMKRLLAILLTLSLTLLCVGALAEPTKLNENYDALDFYLDAPDGVVLEQELFGTGMMGSVQAEAMEDLVVLFALMPDDSYTGLDMDELTDADISDLSGLVAEDMGKADKTAYTLPCGMKAMSILSADHSEYILMTLKDGYFFYMEGVHVAMEEDAEMQALTDEEITLIKTVFDSLSYTENAK